MVESLGSLHLQTPLVNSYSAGVSVKASAPHHRPWIPKLQITINTDQNDSCTSPRSPSSWNSPQQLLLSEPATPVYIDSPRSPRASKVMADALSDDEAVVFKSSDLIQMCGMLDQVNHQLTETPRGDRAHCVDCSRCAHCAHCHHVDCVTVVSMMVTLYLARTRCSTLPFLLLTCCLTLLPHFVHYLR